MNRRTAPMVVALVVALLTVGCNQQQSAEQEPPTPTPIPTPIVPTKPTYTVKRGEVIRQVQFTGRVGPVKEVELFFKVNGRVRNVNVERDAEVKKGDLLADLEIEPLERQVAQAELDLERVQTQLERAQKSQESAVARAQVELSMRALELQRLKNQDMDSLRIQADAAFEAARLNLEHAQSDYDRSPWQGRSGSPQAMELGLKTLKAQVSDSEIAAPFDGKVMSLRISPGSPVEGFAPVVVVADPAEQEIVAEPNSTVLTDLKEGMPTQVALVNVPDKPMTGKIRQLPYPYGSGGATKNDTTNAEKDTSARISLDPDALKDVTLELGDLARVTVVLEKKSDVLWLPPQAVRTFEGRKFVVVQEGDGQRRVDVKIVIQRDDSV
jgi:multidrug efflux pump subunit AcrA (membrane-fusion protein)